MSKSSLKFKRRKYHRRKSIKRNSTKKLSKNMKRSRVNKSKRKNRRRTIRRIMIGGMEAAAAAPPRTMGYLTSDEKIIELIDCLKSNIKERLDESAKTILFLKGNTKGVDSAFSDSRLIGEMDTANLILNDGDNIDESKKDHFCNAFSKLPGSETKLLSLNEGLCHLDYDDKKALVNPDKRSEDTPVVPGVDDLKWFNPSSDHNTLWGILCTIAINEVCMEENLLPVCILLLSDDPSERNKETGALNREIKFWNEFEHPNYVVPRRDSEHTFVLVEKRLAA